MTDSSRSTRRSRLRLTVLTLLATGALVVGLAPAASAQATRTWVSGVGDDANPCSRTAPCKTFQGAISKTATGGVINAIDPAGYGAVTITKSITIDGTGTNASVLTSGTNGIVINAPDNADVVLRNIEVIGMTCSLNGVNILRARSVRLDDVRISGYANAVNAPLTSSSPDLFVDIAVNRAQIQNNCTTGIRIAPDAGHHGRLALSDSTVTNSNVALSVAGGGEAWVTGSKLVLNNRGVQSTGGPIHSMCDNTVAGNAADGAFTDVMGCAGPVAKPAATAPKLCTIPKLKGKTTAKAKKALTSAGCKAGKVGKKKAKKAKRGKVVAQNIPAGTQVRAGTKVNLVIGK